MKFKSEVAALIVSYNPSIERISASAKLLVAQTKEILIIDNASENINELKVSLQGCCNIIENKKERKR